MRCDTTRGGVDAAEKARKAAKHKEDVNQSNPEVSTDIFLHSLL